MKSFYCARNPELHFGSGALDRLAEVLGARGVRRIGIITGGKSFRESPYWGRVLEEMRARELEVSDASIDHEPDIDFVNDITERFRSSGVEAIVGIGGGSALDAGKAVSALARMDGRIEDYLEGVGTSRPTGDKLPYIAVPTTAGTGSEATKNAVIARFGSDGFKKSLRHDAFVPDVAIIDPDLSLNCPAAVTAASGLDAISQLLEAYVSTAANPYTDALAESGLRAARRGFEVVLRESRTRGQVDPEDPSISVYRDARAQMAYAAYLSGVCLANAGLGVVHGIAGPLGARFPVPHGVVCGLLLPGSVRLTVSMLGETDSAAAAESLRRYAAASRFLGGSGSGDALAQSRELVEILDGLVEESALEKFSAWGMDESSAADIAGASGNKNHPVPLSQEDMFRLIASRL